MRASSPASSRPSAEPTVTVRTLAIAAAAPLMASVPPATPSFAAPRAACSAQRSVAITSAAAARAQSRTAAPGTESADFAAAASIAPAAPPGACPCSRACTARSSNPMLQSEKSSHEPARANEIRGRPMTSAHAIARRNNPSAYPPTPVASSSVPATPCPTGPAQFRETAAPGRYDQSPSNISSANPPSRIPATGLFHATGALFFRPMKPPHVASGDSRRGPGSVNFSGSKKPPSIARRSRFTVELPQPIVLRFSSRPAEGDASMEVRCDKCQARYRVDDARIGPQGLTMRCGKCQNTFKVMPAGAVPEQPKPVPAAAPAPKPAPAAPKPAPRAAEPAPNATMVFGQTPAPKPAMPAPAARPPAAAAKPVAAPAKPAAAAPADEGAGRTMMFQTGNLKTGAGKPAPRAEPEGGATMVFGQSPLAAKPAAAAPKPAPRPADSDSGSTMVFGQSPLLKPAPPAAALAKPAAAAVKPAVAPALAPEPEPTPE